MPRTIAVPVGLQTIIDTHRALFGGFTMQAEQDTPPAENPPVNSGEDNESAGGDGDTPLGPAGERALAAVRDENKQLRQELTGFKQALTQALGIEPSDKRTDALGDIQQEVAALRKENTVQRVARTHGITDEDDIALLMQADSGFVETLAARLKPAASDSGSKTPTYPPGARPVLRLPPPDPAAGKGNNGRRPSSVQQAAEDYRARNEKKKTT